MCIPIRVEEHTMQRCIPKFAVAIAALMLGISRAAWPADAPAADAAADAVNGQRLFLAVGCFECHGRAGQGGRFNYPAPALAQTPLPLVAFRALVRAGPNDMPAYAERVLSDQNVADILAFLQSLPGRRPVKDIPLLNP
jgi:mono/diheme cytochrome c family protein